MLSCYLISNWKLWNGAFLVFLVLLLFYVCGFALYIKEEVLREDEPKAWAKWRKIIKLELVLIVIFLLIPSYDFILRYISCK